MNIDIFMPFYPADYFRETQDLSTAEHGAYVLLLLCFWVADGKLPDNDTAFASITRLDADTWRVQFRPRLERLFKIKNGFWTHQRIIEERSKARKISKLRSAAGKMGGRPIKSKTKAKSNQAANQTSNLL